MIPRKWQSALRFAPLFARVLRLPADRRIERFVLIAARRSGSTWLVDLLDSHPRITCYSELFAHEFYGKPPAGGNTEVRTWNSYAAEHDADLGRLGRVGLFFRYLDDQVYAPRTGAATAGFKLLYDQALRGFGLMAYLRARRVRIVHLVRRNHLDTILSEEARIVRSVSHAEVGVPVQQVRVNLDLPSLPRRLAEREAAVVEARRCCAALGGPYHEVGYEELLADPGRLDAVIRFLGLEPVESGLRSSMQKLNPTSHRELIANYDAVRARLAETPFAALLR
jgi:LPS sulfotransferase NodH